MTQLRFRVDFFYEIKLVARWTPYLKRTDIPQEKYAEAAEKLDNAFRRWKATPRLSGDPGFITAEDGTKLSNLMREVAQAVIGNLCKCDLRILTCLGCQCGGV